MVLHIKFTQQLDSEKCAVYLSRAKECSNQTQEPAWRFMGSYK